MVVRLDPPLVPRNGHTPRVLVICRISTVHQDIRSLADQEALYRRWLEDHTKHPVEIRGLRSQGSGESLERPDYLEALDLVLSEDMARISRRVHAFLFCEDCADAGTRLVALNDSVDTGRDDWRLSSFFAAMRHESYNKDTSARIRRSQRHRNARDHIVVMRRRCGERIRPRNSDGESPSVDLFAGGSLLAGASTQGAPGR